MKLLRRLNNNPRALLNLFIYGSTIFLLVCLFGAAFFFSNTYLQKQRVRLEESRDLISDFFDFQYRAISEEMWTQNYSSIRSRVSEIARQLSHAQYDLVLVDEYGVCRASFLDQQGGGAVDGLPESECKIPEELASKIGTFQPNVIKAVTRFDETKDRYLYIVPLFVGTVLKGYLYAEISDPYGFCAENSVILVMKLFFMPIMGILALWFAWLLYAKKFILKPYFNIFVKMEKMEALADLAGQVAHNIRSPLVVINSIVRNFQGSNDPQKKLLIAVATRIEDLANDLITHYQGKEAPKGTEEFCFLLPVVDSILVEKRELLKNNAVEIATENGSVPAASVVPLKASDLAIVLSNLINNAIEACRDFKDRRGTVRLILNCDDQGQAVICIADNGKGMSAQVLNLVSSVGGTFEKEGGLGIGLQHARGTISKAGGDVKIASKQGLGTEIKIVLPLVSVPKWCPRSLDLSRFSRIVVMDDDPAMRLLWEQRLSGANTVLLSSPSQFDVNQYPRDSTYFIFDHDFGGSATTGLDLIASHGLGQGAVLVTSHFENAAIQAKVLESGAQLLPKFLASQIDLALPQEGLRDACRYDLVLIDDDPMMHELWTFEASQQGKRLYAVKDLEELDVSQFEYGTPIYVDKNLENEVSGLSVARDLFERGYVNISLTTGDRISSFEVPHFIRSVTNKDFPAA